jgi:hypothetical protein
LGHRTVHHLGAMSFMVSAHGWDSKMKRSNTKPLAVGRVYQGVRVTVWHLVSFSKISHDFGMVTRMLAGMVASLHVTIIVMVLFSHQLDTSWPIRGGIRSGQIPQPPNLAFFVFLWVVKPFNPHGVTVISRLNSSYHGNADLHQRAWGPSIIWRIHRDRCKRELKLLVPNKVLGGAVPVISEFGPAHNVFGQA